MDAFSAFVGVVQLISFTADLVKKLRCFIEKTKHIDKSIRHLYDEIRELNEALENIRSTLDRRTRQLPFEREHHTKTHQIIQSCHTWLELLYQQLPSLEGGSGAIKRVQRSIVQCLKEDKVQDILRHITSYKTILQLSLATLSLGAMWETERSQKHIEIEVRKLSSAIRSSPLFLNRANNEGTLLNRTQSLDSEPEGGNREETALEKEIRDWGRTARDVKIAFMDTESSCDESSTAPNSSLSDDTLAAYDDTFDPEPNRSDRQNNKLLKYNLHGSREMVREFMQSGLYVQALEHQRKGIEFLEQLLESRDPTMPDETSYSYEQLTIMREELVNILLFLECPKADLEAKKELQQLLDEEVKRGAGQADNGRQARLYHKLGQVYFNGRNSKQARKFLKRAIDDRKQMKPTPYDLIKESAELLVEVLRQDQAYDEVSGLLEWIRRELQPDTTFSPSSTSSQTIQDEAEISVGTDLTSAYQWCREQGMDVDNGTFRFDIRDPVKGTTPLHHAVQKEDIDALRHMLPYVADKEQRNERGSTLLHEAAAMRNRHLCALLLEEHLANPNVVDENGRTPLHRCQTISGGLGAARTLLKSCPGLINLVEYYGKTALYMACEMGNEKMAKILLSEGRADPNIQGPGQLTPLILAIDLAARSARKISVVQLLVVHGANPWITDAEGRTAFDAASGLASREITLMLEDIPSRRTSTMTVKTAKSSSSSKKKSSNTKGYLTELRHDFVTD